MSIRTVIARLLGVDANARLQEVQDQLIALQKQHIELLRQQPGGVASLQAPQLGTTVRWTAEDEHQLIALRAKGYLIRQCAAEMNRSYTSVYQRWQLLRKAHRHLPGSAS